MTKIINFPTEKLANKREKSQENKTPNVDGSQEKKRKKGNSAVTKEVYQLWLLSKDIDELVIHAVSQKNLQPEEIAAVLANRLGAVIWGSQNPQALLMFCESLLRRQIVNETQREGLKS